MSQFDFWVEISATAAVIMLIPIYMGFIHVPLAGAVAYAAVGGAAMTIGEHIQFRLQPLKVREAVIEFLLWGAAISGVGGVAYLLALIFI